MTPCPEDMFAPAMKGKLTLKVISLSGFENKKWSTEEEKGRKNDILIT